MIVTQYFFFAVCSKSKPREEEDVVRRSNKGSEPSAAAHGSSSGDWLLGSSNVGLHKRARGGIILSKRGQDNLGFLCTWESDLVLEASNGFDTQKVKKHVCSEQRDTFSAEPRILHAFFNHTSRTRRRRAQCEDLRLVLFVASIIRMLITLQLGRVCEELKGQSQKTRSPFKGLCSASLAFPRPTHHHMISVCAEGLQGRCCTFLGDGTRLHAWHCRFSLLQSYERLIGQQPTTLQNVLVVSL